MKARTFLACAALVATACGEDSPSAPSSGSAVLRANVAASAEIPPVTGAEAGGVGTATLTLTTTRDRDGVITGATLDTTIAVSGFPAGTRFTGASIQVGGAAANGAVVQDTGLAAQGGAVLASGTGTITARGTPVSALVANALLANPAGYYLNLQSALNPAGVTRGQLLFP